MHRGSEPHLHRIWEKFFLVYRFAHPFTHDFSGHWMNGRTSASQSKRMPLTISRTLPDYAPREDLLSCKHPSRNKLACIASWIKIHHLESCLDCTQTYRVIILSAYCKGVFLSQGIQINGESCAISQSLQIAQLALKHRQNKLHRQRIILFVASPIAEDKVYLTAVGNLLWNVIL